ncbi:MAG: adenosylcobalamin-dependent ribonucleoside-diphosphate reductase [Nitrospirales bacterium]|nr:adenosylcobalamin-dependent ribonucleoside-diphosphate reductase [Nitrospirales bacterium]
MELTENALTVLKARYLLRDEKGELIETPEEMFRRVARTVASAEALYNEDPSYWEERFYDLMTSLKFLPNSPTLMNAGKTQGQLAACFVLPVEDSIKAIFDTLKNAALILQSGGGTGFSFSHLRPRADVARSTGGIASGPVSFMRIYNTATEVVKQGGARRGANMGMLRVDHPDIMEFIRLKRTEGELTNFTISVSITDSFMDALRTDREYSLINPRSGETVGRLRAKEVFGEMARSAWEAGDPGVIFIDRINRSNPTPHIGRIESTNPCGEQPLLPYEACVLGSMNLSLYVSHGVMDYASLGRDVQTAVRFLDDTIDVNIYPLPEIEGMHKGNRKIGLGVMGWADALILLGIPYNSERAFQLAKRLMGFIQAQSKEASLGMAEIRGVFPNFQGSVYDRPGMPRVRNATTTTIAPTGTLATIAGCSSGIEPLFAVAYKRFVLDSELTEVSGQFVRMALEKGFYTEELMQKIMEKGCLRGIAEVPPDIKRLFRTAMDITPEEHIEMQAAFQEHTDNAVSKTINLPFRATEGDVTQAFSLAYEKGLKGITVFRYGSKRGTLVRFQDAD